MMGMRIAPATKPPRCANQPTPRRRRRRRRRIAARTRSRWPNRRGGAEECRRGKGPDPHARIENEIGRDHARHRPEAPISGLRGVSGVHERHGAERARRRRRAGRTRGSGNVPWHPPHCRRTPTGTACCRSGETGAVQEDVGGQRQPPARRDSLRQDLVPNRTEGSRPSPPTITSAPRARRSVGQDRGRACRPIRTASRWASSCARGDAVVKREEHALSGSGRAPRERRARPCH